MCPKGSKSAGTDVPRVLGQHAKMCPEDGRSVFADVSQGQHALMVRSNTTGMTHHWPEKKNID